MRSDQAALVGLLSGRVGWMGKIQRTTQGRIHGVNKLYGDCSSWSLQVSGYFDQAGGEYEKRLLPALLFLEKSLVNPFSLTGVV